MNSVHDLGGMDGFGSVIPEADEPTFHADWERRVLAIVLAIGALGRWNIDQNRHSRERLEPVLYLGSSYYRIWFLALERNLRDTGLLDEPVEALDWSRIRAGLDRGTPYARPVGEARFSVGDRVRCRNLNPTGHTRLPRWARGHVGVVALHHGGHVFPDRNAAPLGERGADTGEHLYTVEFPATELWGDDADPGVLISIDAFEPYLEPA